MVVVTMSVAIHFQVQEKPEIKHLIVGVNVMILYGALMLIVTFYCLILIGVKLRFKKINDVLENEKIYLNISKNLLSTLYIQLYDVCTQVNRILGLPVGLFWLFNLVTMTFTYFEIYLQIFFVRTNFQLQFCILTNIWNSFLTLYMLGSLR